MAPIRYISYFRCCFNHNQSPLKNFLGFNILQCVMWNLIVDTMMNGWITVYLVFMLGSYGLHFIGVSFVCLINCEYHQSDRRWIIMLCTTNTCMYCKILSILLFHASDSIRSRRSAIFLEEINLWNMQKRFKFNAKEGWGSICCYETCDIYSRSHFLSDSDVYAFESSC